MNKNDPVVVIMGQNCEDFLRICLKSVQGARQIVYVDGGSTDTSQRIALEAGAKLLVHPYNKADKLANSKQRQFYLKYLQQEHMGEICLVLDADELVDDFPAFQERLINTDINEDWFVAALKMRHLMWGFGYEDATDDGKGHIVLNRLFRITDDVFYPDGEHAFLHSKIHNGKGHKLSGAEWPVIWHLSYCPNVFGIRSKYLTHREKSEIHSRQYLDDWYRKHLFGTYPVRRIDLQDLPTLLLEEFHIDKDELYFASRGVETKHFVDARHWKDFFGCQDVIEWGAGRGPRVFAMRVVGINAVGIEISRWAIDHKLVNEITYGDITTTKPIVMEADLAIAYDVLEHIPYESLGQAIENLKKSTKKWILISVPVIGDPNLENDKTHIVKETKDWWLARFASHNLKHVETPAYFLYRNQVMIFEKV